MKAISKVIFCILLLSASFNVNAVEKEKVIYLDTKGFFIGDVERNAAWVTKYKYSDPAFSMVTIKDQSELGSSCVIEKYYHIRGSQMTETLDYFYCKGFISENSIRIDTLYLEKTYSIDNKLKSEFLNLLANEKNYNKSTFLDIIRVIDQVTMPANKISEDKNNIDELAFWRSGRISIKDIPIRLSPSVNGNYIKAEFIK